MDFKEYYDTGEESPENDTQIIDEGLVDEFYLVHSQQNIFFARR